IFIFVKFVQCSDPIRSFYNPLLRFGGPSFSATMRLFVAGRDPQAAKLRLGRLWLRVSIGLVVLEHEPSDRDQLSRRRNHGDISVLLFQEPSKKNTQRSRIFSKMLRGLNEHPSRVRTSLLGDRSVVTSVPRLFRHRNEPEIARSMIAILEARWV